MFLHALGRAQGFHVPGGFSWHWCFVFVFMFMFMFMQGHMELGDMDDPMNML